MYVLDTDHMSLLEWGGDDSTRLRERLADLDSDQLYVTIVSYEEQVRGWMNYLAKAKTTEQQVVAYARLRHQLANYCETSLLDFSNDAAEKYDALRSSKSRVGSMDLRIASIVLANDMILLTRNTVDFERVPGLKFEDVSHGANRGNGWSGGSSVLGGRQHLLYASSPRRRCDNDI